jgi:hypothetical protein
VLERKELPADWLAGAQFFKSRASASFPTRARRVEKLSEVS